MLEDIIARVERMPIMQPGETAPNHPLENVIARVEGRAPMQTVNPLQQGKTQPPVNRSQLSVAGAQPTDGQEPGFFRELGKGAVSGWQGANKAVNDVLEYTGTLTGIDTLKEVGKTGSEYWGDKLKGNTARVQNFTDLDWSKPRDVLDWAAWNIGQMGSQIAVTLPFMAMGGGAGAGVITGGQALKGGMPLWKYISNRGLTFLENLLLGAKLSEYHTGYRAFSRNMLERLPLEKNSDDFLFDNQILAQILWLGYTIAEVSCPTKYFTDASSINFKRSVRYGIGCLVTAMHFRLARLGIVHHGFLER